MFGDLAFFSWNFWGISGTFWGRFGGTLFFLCGGNFGGRFYSVLFFGWLESLDFLRIVFLEISLNF